MIKRRDLLTHREWWNGHDVLWQVMSLWENELHDYNGVMIFQGKDKYEPIMISWAKLCDAFPIIIEKVVRLKLWILTAKSHWTKKFSKIGRVLCHCFKKNIIALERFWGRKVVVLCLFISCVLDLTLPSAISGFVFLSSNMSPVSVGFFSLWRDVVVECKIPCLVRLRTTSLIRSSLSMDVE